ncbi:Scr1 family TA system antitoxin-like transcriptional regulator [Streptomyces sp. NPDC007264]|uniref:helix-turn-helix domain-containing protein n=1 Tax=Streptomyces sp. NPDC007264 TaxID=3364777 RepID=UPI0036DC2AC4
MAALFGARVRRLRTAAGLTQAELGRTTHVVSTRITQIERASGAKPTLGLARALDAALGADNLLPVGGAAVMREQLERLLEAAAEPHITVQVLPFDQGEHGAMGGSLTILTLYEGSEAAYTEGAHHGQLIEDPAEVRRFSLTYDRLRAAALPPLMSLDMIRSVMEGNHRGAKVPSRSERRRVAQEQLQQSGGRQLRRGGRRVPRHRPRP